MRIISILHGLSQINVAKFLLQPCVVLLASTLRVSSTLILHHILWNRDKSRRFIVLHLLFLLKIVLFWLVWGLMLLSYGDKLSWSLIISDFIFARVDAQPAQPSKDLRAWASCCCCYSVVLIVGSRGGECMRSCRWHRLPRSRDYLLLLRWWRSACRGRRRGCHVLSDQVAATEQARR